MRHSWNDIDGLRAFCVKCGLIRTEDGTKRGYIYTPQDITEAVRNFAGACPGFHAHITQGVAFGFHKCPRGGECYCKEDKPECLIKTALSADQPVQLKLF